MNKSLAKGISGVLLASGALMAIVTTGSATTLTFQVSPAVNDGGNYRYAHLFGNSTDGSPWAPICFSDYGDRVTGATQTGMGKNGFFTYFYGTSGGATPHIVADYPGNDAGNDTSGYNYGMDIIQNSYDALDSTYAYSLIPYYPDLGTTKRQMITLTADPGYFVSLRGFVIEDFFGQKHVAALDVIGINADNTTTQLWAAASPDAVFGHSSRAYTMTDFGGGPLMYRSIAIEFQETANDINYFAFTNIEFQQDIPEPTSVVFLMMGGLFLWRRRK